MKHFILLHKKMVLVVSTIVLTMIVCAFAFLNGSVFNNTFDIVFFFIVALVGLAVFVVSFVLLFFKEWPIHKLFLVVGSALGLISMFINTPGSVPDETAHIKNAYLWTNRLFGIHDTVSDRQISDVYICYTSSVRKEDMTVFGDILEIDASLRTYTNTSKDFRLFTSSDGEQLVNYDFQDNRISPIAYFPAIFGVTVARLLHLGGVPLIYLSRLFMLAFYIFGIYWAMKRIPFGKITIFNVAILPMCVHLAPSFSYDAVIITLSMKLIAQILYLAYGDNQRIGWKEVVLSCLLVLLFTPLKIMIYLPMVSLFFLIPKSKFASKRKGYLFCFSMLLLGIASVIISNLSMILSYSPGNTLVNQFVNPVQPAYTAAWLVQHPIDTLSIMFKTTVVNFIYYYITMVGGLLGWLNTPVAHWIIYLFAFCFIASCLSEKDQETVMIKMSHRFIFVIPVLFTYLFVLLGMMIWWTHCGTDVIQGIQGRYFIPVLPLLVFSLYGFRRFQVRKGFWRVNAIVSITLTLLASQSMLVTILSR